MTTMVVLPGISDATVALLAQKGGDVLCIEPIPGPEESLVARVNAAIRLADPRPPLAIVAAGDSASWLPSVALAQSSAHRLVLGYLLIDPVLPPVGDRWPDAPVSVLSSDDWVCTQTRLRGWEFLEDLGSWTVPTA